MKVKWMPQAKWQVRDIARYIRKEFGKKVRDDFMKDIRESSRLIGHTPTVGKTEPLLMDCQDMYRSFVVNHLNKIVYRILDDCVEVVDFWDVRREPSALAENIEES